HAKNFLRSAAETERHPRAAAVGPLRDDLPAVRDCNLADDREPEPRAWAATCGSRTTETVEDVRKVFLVDSGAVVAHADFAVSHRDLDVGARGAPLRSVVEQVCDRALDRRMDSLDGRF